jgi:hypothetical protein
MSGNDPEREGVQRDGTVALVAGHLPYRKRFLRGFQFEKPFAQTSEPRIFKR